MVQGTDTAQRLLVLARDLITRGGYNALSYRDLAKELNIRTASIHYHYPEKADLGRAVIQSQHDLLLTAGEALLLSPMSANDKLDVWFELAFAVSRTGDQICLLGILEAEFETYPKTMKDAVTRLAIYQRQIIASVLEQGRKEGVLRFEGDAIAQATLVVTAIQGSLQLSRALQDASVLATTIQQLKVSMRA